MKWKLHQYLYKIFPNLLNRTSTALVLAKTPDKADDEVKQEEDKIKSFLLLPTLDKQNGESDDSLLLAESCQPFLLQSLQMAMVVHVKEQEVGENLLGNRVPNLIRNDSYVSFLLPVLTAQLHVEGLIV